MLNVVMFTVCYIVLVGIVLFFCHCDCTFVS